MDSTTSVAVAFVVFVAAGIGAFLMLIKKTKEPTPEPSPPVSESRKLEKNKSDKAPKIDRTAKANQPKIQQVIDKAASHPLFLNAFKGFNASIECVAVSPDSTKIAVANSESTIRVYDVNVAALAQLKESPSYIRVSMPGSDYPSVCDFTSDNGSLVSISANERKLIVHKLEKPNAKLTFQSKDPVHKNSVRWMYSSQGQWVVTCSEDDDTEVKVWSYQGQLLSSYNTKQIRNFFCATSLIDGRFLGVAAWSPGIKIMEIHSKNGAFAKLDKAMDLKTSCGCNAFAISPDNTRAVVFAKDQNISVWNINVRYNVSEDPKKISEAKDGDDLFKTTHMMAITPDNRHVVFVAEGHIKIAPIDDPTNPVHVIEDAHTGKIRSLAIAPDGSYMVTGAAEHKPRVWKLPA